MPHLLLSQGDRPLLTHMLRPGRTVIGRSDRSDIALPSNALSRTHCTVEQRPEGWLLTDRSRHGITVNNIAAERYWLEDGDVVKLGEYHMAFRETAVINEFATETLNRKPRPHEEIVEVGVDGIAAVYVVLRILRGPQAGSTHVLKRDRTSIGGKGSQFELNASLPKNAFYVRVVRGRALVEPGAAAVFLAGSRVRQVVPALFGEQIRCGEHAMVVESQTLQESVEQPTFGDMVGASPVMRKLFGVLSRIAGHDAPALIVGPSGTGKELTARGLHDTGLRAGGPFIAVNCAGIPHTLFESELFGHEKGAFTGASERRDGAFHRAHGGTLFLDELGELALDAQAKLLRVLESGEVRRVGGGTPEYPDVRIVAATNRDLTSMIVSGSFREDLYFRLAVLSVSLPPLSERVGDIPLIADALLRRNHPDAVLTPGARTALSAYNWPGNIRELRNVLTRAYVLAGPRIDAADLSFNPLVFDRAPARPTARTPLGREQIEAALARVNGNRTKAAAQLGLPRSSLLYRMRKLGLM